ncbi:alphaK A5 [Puccinia graminis f. sp. tritici CRL 75-36-700-3]|uniref:AlphaK A5 n=1 Tax=Puccinia graminis f. sp. tritici (strain CRL 75-36-700-3 / race SCCL) TaxID=418459 RepID=E3JXX8_PUCGT|nr:alphaK A5 [Puccinia graminis f. sp. tritici CRL 75-36-700-3]EFP76903.2 alphaK A5 [Puccinia graminis f. sp. tritici CRL 75-36-700-3]
MEHCIRCGQFSSVPHESHPTAPKSLPAFASRASLTTGVSQAAPPLPAASSRPTLQLPAVPSREDFCGAVKAKRKKNPPAVSAPYPKKKPAPVAPLAPASFAPTANDRLLDCGLLLYQGKKLTENSGITNIMQRVDISNPSLFEDLQAQLWHKFSGDILAKTSIKSFPEPAKNHISLVHGKSRLTDLESLLFVIHKPTNKKAHQVHLSYHHPYKHMRAPTPDDSELDSNNSDTDSVELVTKPLTRSKFKHATSPMARWSTSGPKGDSWELRGVACTIPARGNTSLSTQIHKSPDFDNFSYKKCFQLTADAEPITLRVHLNKVVGEGSMRRAFKAEVKLALPDSTVEIINYVAKIRYNNTYPNITTHATDARMYEASALLLDEFKKVIIKSKGIKLDYVAKSRLMEIIRHAVVVTGDPSIPSEVYFLEAELDGRYVKYSSNVNFKPKMNNSGIDPILSHLMSAFTHWTYTKSDGKSLICDLQGVGSILTDTQIIDVDETRWADGNNSKYGITCFLEEHVCNDLCKALKLPKPIPDKNTAQVMHQPTNIQQGGMPIPACKRQQVPLSNQASSSNQPHQSIYAQSVQIKNPPSSSNPRPPVNRGSLAHVLHHATGRQVDCESLSSSFLPPPENTGS